MTVSFGLWIRQRRRALDMTQDDLAERVGCSSSAIRKIEADERRPSRQVAELLADTLQIEAADRPTFLKVARLELGFDRLETLRPPAALATLAAPAHLRDHPPIASVAGNGARRAPTPRNLPTPPTPMVGREVEVSRIAEILSGAECRLLTLVGPGGIGKTRLAIAAAERLAADCADGIYFVSLAVVTAPESILAAVASALGFGFHGSADPKAQLISYLQPKALLLVLDNLEHLLEGVDIVAELLQQAIGVKVLATSRERLGLSGEWVLDIHGLGVPAPVAQSDAALPPNWDRSSAVSLFLQSARRCNPQFAVQPADYSAIVQICQMVEGIPLGIELAAAWVRVLTCREIAHEIERSLDFLATTARDVPHRQRSLRAAFDHSWRLLPEEEQMILRRLSVFRGGFTRGAAERVAGATLLSLATLMAKSLALRNDDGRYDLHQIIRQYAAEKLDEAGEAEAIHTRHWHAFLAMAEAADVARNSPEHMQLVDQLELESDNIQSALAFLIEHNLEQAWRFVGMLEPFWYRRPVSEVDYWYSRLTEAGAEVVQTIAPGLRGRVLLVLATFKASLDELMVMAHEVLELARAADDHRITAIALAILGTEGIVSGDFSQSSIRFDEAQRLAEESNDRATLATVLSEHGEAERYQGRYAQAVEYYSASLALAQSIGRSDLIASGMISLAKLALRQGEPQKAQTLLVPALEIWEAIHDQVGLTYSQLLLARAVTIQGEYERARAIVAEAEAASHGVGFHGVDNFIAVVIGEVEYLLGRVDRARQLYEQAIELCSQYFEPLVMTLALRGVACCALRQGDLQRARVAIQQSKSISESTNEKWVAALIEFPLGQIAKMDGDLPTAIQCFQAGLQLVLQLGDRCAVIEGAERLALILAETGQPRRAAMLFGAATALRQQIGAPLPPIDRDTVAQGIAAVQALLSTDDFEASWALGKIKAELSLSQVVEYALEYEPTVESFKMKAGE